MRGVDVAAGAAVVASTPVTLAQGSFAETAVSLGLGLIGVWLARLVFVDRQNRQEGRRASARETLPLTLTAMLIAGVIIVDRGLGFSGAAFTGLGVGWVAVLALDALGNRALDVMRAIVGLRPVADRDNSDDKAAGDNGAA